MIKRFLNSRQTIELLLCETPKFILRIYSLQVTMILIQLTVKCGQ